MNLRLGIILHHIENAPYADNSETMYYGSVIKDPDMGVRYTFVKSPNGDITLLKTESTDEVLEAIDKLVEVGLESTWEPRPSKLTFLVKWDDVDYVYTWNDRITEQFKIMVDDRFDELKPYISTVNCDDSKSINMPFISDNAVCVTFEFTTGRSIKYLNKLIPELFRRIMDEHLLIDNKIEELMNDKFLMLDRLKANDSRQDNEVVKAAIADSKAHAVRKNIEDWLNKYNDLFQPRHVMKTFDLTKYQPNQKCYITLTSKVLEDEPVLESDIFTENGKDAIFVKHTTGGMVLKEVIRWRTGNKLSGSENFAEHTFIAYGGTKLVIYTSSKYTQINVLKTSTLVDDHSHDIRYGSEIVSDLNIKNELLMLRESDGAAIYPTLSGTPPKEGPVAYVYDWIWRAATKSNWGAGWGGNNTQCLKENRDIGDFCNTRKTFLLMDGVTIRDLVNNYETLTIYIDGYYGLASGGGDGGIQSVYDCTPGGNRLSYQGYGYQGNNEASIPNNKLRVPLKMTNINQTAGCMSKITIQCSNLKMDGSWCHVYTMPTGGRFGATIAQGRRKNRLLGCISWTYYLRVKSETELEMLVNYFQNADGDRGNHCFTQAAGRDSYFIYGNKRNTLQVNMKDKWSGKTVATYPATEYKQTTPSLRIEDIENNYIGYLPLKENAGTNTYKVDDLTTGKVYYAAAAQIKSGRMFMPMNLYANVKSDDKTYIKEISLARIPGTSSIYNLRVNLPSEIKFSNNKEKVLVTKDYDNDILYDELSEPLFNINDNKYYIKDTNNKLIEVKDNFTNILKPSNIETDLVSLNIETNMDTKEATGNTFISQNTRSINIDIDMNEYYDMQIKGYKYKDTELISLDKEDTEYDLDIIVNIGENRTIIKRKIIKTYNNSTDEFIITAIYIIPPYLNLKDYIINLNVLPNYELINKE